MNIWRVMDFLPHSISSVGISYSVGMKCPVWWMVSGLTTFRYFQIIICNTVLKGKIFLEMTSIPGVLMTHPCASLATVLMWFVNAFFWNSFFNFPVQSTAFRFPGSPTNNLVLILLSFSELARFSLWCHLVDLNKFT